ncbi:MAG TPA: hypothetical protein VNS02_13745 [Rhizobiaceae bacterium]|nr:hypothetical protein [Rhizobiaceae bacterium]
MPEVTNELIYELTKRMHHELSEVRQDVGDVKRLELRELAEKAQFSYEPPKT